MTRSHLQIALDEYLRTGKLEGFSGGDHDPNDPPKDPNDPPADPPKDPDPPKFNAEQQAEINRIVAKEVRDAKKKAADEERARIQKEKDDAEAEAKRKKDEEAGEYEKVKSQLVQERDDWKGKHDVLESDYKTLEGLFLAQYDAAVAKLPEVIAAFKPADDAKLSTKVEWLKTAQEQVEKLGDAGTTGGSRPNPGKPNGGNPPTAPDFKKERITLFG